MKFHSKYLSLLRCPSCHGRFWQTTPHALRCSCDVYPVFGNTAYLIKRTDGRHRRAVYLLARGKKRRALLLLLDGRRIANMILSYAPVLHFNTFLAILSVLYPESSLWWRYMKNRDVRITHILATSVIADIKRSDVVIDVCCGTGNFIRHISSVHRPKCAIGIDSSLFLLAIATRFFPVSSDEIYVCADVNTGLPLSDSSVNGAYLNDCFMYIQKQKTLKELKRVFQRHARAFITHVHTKHSDNAGQGNGVTPTRFRTMCRGTRTLFYIPDRDFAYALLHKKPITYHRVPVRPVPDRSYSYVITETRSQKTLSMPASHHTPNHIDFTEDEGLRHNTP